LLSDTRKFIRQYVELCRRGKELVREFIVLMTFDPERYRFEWDGLVEFSKYALDVKVCGQVTAGTVDGKTGSTRSENYDSVVTMGADSGCALRDVLRFAY